MPRPLEPMSCEQIQDQVEAFLDRELDEPAAFQVHLEGCTECQTELRLAEEIRRELRALPGLDAPSAVLDEVFRQVDSARLQPVTEPLRFDRHLQTGDDSRFRHRPAWAALAAALFAAMVLGAGFWMRPLELGRGEEIAAAQAESAEVARATEEARYALAYLAQMSRKTGLKLRQDLLEDHLMKPSTRSLSRVLSLGASPQDRSAGAAESATQVPDRS